MSAEEYRVLVAPGTHQLALNEIFYQGIVQSELLRKRQFLQRFFTNLDGRVTALTNKMPSRLAAAVTARLSRATIQDITELYWQEFVHDPELGISQLMEVEEQSVQSLDSLLRTDKAGKMISRIVDKFGDDSVREQASGYVMIQDGSVLVSMDTFRRGTLITGIEASTRYIPFNKRDESGRYRYVKAPADFDAHDAQVYEMQQEFAFNTYSELWPLVWQHVERTNPRISDVSEAAYNSAVLGKVCDLLRGLLPLGSKTNFALHGDYRNLSELIVSLRGSELAESRQTANLMAAELIQVSPEFVKMVDSDHGLAWTEYERTVSRIMKDYALELNIDADTNREPGVEVRVLNVDYMADLLTTMVNINRPGADSHSVRNAVGSSILAGDDEEVLTKIKQARKNRRHKLPSPAAVVVVAAKLKNLSFGALKDMNRHRNVLAKSGVVLEDDQGADIPNELKNVDEHGAVYAACVEVQRRAMEAYKLLKQRHPEEAKLVLTHGTRGSMSLVMHLGEEFWIEEIRSMASGNPEYRRFAQALHRELLKVMPGIEPLGTFVDFTTDYQLGRITEAVRADLKGKF